jgi:hypothetical protein
VPLDYHSLTLIYAWHDKRISPEVTVMGFKKSCISNALDRTDDNDDVLWKDSEEDGNVRSECEEDEDTDCEDGDSDSDW